MLELIFLLWTLLCPNPTSTNTNNKGGVQVTTLDTGGETGHVPPKPPPPPPGQP